MVAHEPSVAEAALAQQLVEDVNDLLDVGDVGLYELLWILRGWSQPGTRQDWIRIASAAAERVLSSGRARLAWLQWPGESADGGKIRLDGTDARDPWKEPTEEDKVYAAFLPVEVTD